jgi:hypothetical protein
MSLVELQVAEAVPAMADRLHLCRVLRDFAHRKDDVGGPLTRCLGEASLRQRSWVIGSLRCYSRRSSKLGLVWIPACFCSPVAIDSGAIMGTAIPVKRRLGSADLRKRARASRDTDQARRLLVTSAHPPIPLNRPFGYANVQTIGKNP